MKIPNLRYLFINNTNNVWLQLFRYTFVGGSAFVVDFLLLWLLTDFCGLNYLISATISFIVGLCVNYFISVRVVFFQSKVDDKRLEFLYVALIGGVGVGLNDLFIWLLTAKVGIYYMLSKILTAVVVYLYNFFARRYLIYVKKK
ncbi:MAG: GtrA family protein [Bacteroidales bacterium]|nr:GtrA family protein [Bacteroidales bacterium]